MSSSVACIIYNNGKIFIAHRLPGGDMGDRWEFPGGKVEPGEGDAVTVEREMSEEFGVKAVAGKKISSTSFVHNGKECFLNAYLVTLANDGMEAPFSLSEHSEYKWVSPEEIPVSNFVDSDLKILPDVLSYLEKNK